MFEFQIEKKESADAVLKQHFFIQIEKIEKH